MESLEVLLEDRADTLQEGTPVVDIIKTAGDKVEITVVALIHRRDELLPTLQVVWLTVVHGERAVGMEFLLITPKVVNMAVPILAEVQTKWEVTGTSSMDGTNRRHIYMQCRRGCNG